MGFPMPGQGNDSGFDGGSGGAPQNDYQGDVGKVNPAWEKALSVIPQDLHSQVIPTFREWDQNFQKVQQGYAPYKQFADSGMKPEQLQQAVQLMQALEQNPEGVYKLLHQEFGGQQNPVPQVPGSPNGQGQPGNVGNPGDDIWEGVHPAIRQQVEQMKAATDTMAEIMLGQRQQSQQQQQDQELAELYTNLENSDPVFKELNKDGAAEPYINSMLQAGYEPEDALQAFKGFVESVGQYNNRPKPPVVFGAGGNIVPQQGFNPKNLNPQQTKNLVADTLKAALHNNQ
jgi:hypothetical protein